MHKWQFIGVWVLTASAVLLGKPAGAAPADHSNDFVTLTVRAVCTTRVHRKAEDGNLDDKIAVALAERDVYRIVNWSDTSVDLEFVSGQRTIDPQGSGTWAVPGVPATVTGAFEKWTYQKGPQPDTPECGLTIDPRGENSTVSLLNYCHNSSAVKTQPEDTAQALALTVADMTLTSYTTDDLAKGTPSPMSQQLKFRFSPDQKHVIAAGNGSHKFEWRNEQGLAIGTGTLSVSFTVDIGVTPPEKPKAELQEIDAKWLPQESNSVGATIRVTGEKPADAFRLTLYDVSKEPGLCCNSGDAGTEPDLSFAPDQGDWSVKPDGDHWVATNDGGGMSATAQIACHDWGAWGKLKGEAKIEGKWEPAKTGGAGLDYVRIPYDDDDDHIADSWQADYGVAGQSAKDDSGKQPTDQANDGDGLSVYECYRGFEVLGEGGKEHVSIDPRQKVLFVLDDSGYFSPATWEHASGIKAYALSAEMCEPGAKPEAARKVNFRSSYAKNGDKYGLVVTVVPGASKDSDGDMPAGLCDDDSGGPQCPKHVTGLYLYPGNVMSLVNTAVTELGIAVAQPNSPQAQAWDKLGLPRWMWKRALDRLMSEAYRQKLVDQMMRQTAVHELGHACGLWGHFKAGDPARQETFGLGDKACPMYYGEGSENQRYLILQVLLNPDATASATAGQFCKTDLNCWRHLNVKDN